MSLHTNKEFNDLQKKVEKLSRKEEERSMWFWLRIKILGFIIIVMIGVAIFSGG